ncbi:MAG TPA: hypothetical protein VFM71_12120 [Gemmatimonadaceae bacterium]|nr:hypothetical protein [Gemmatimonadaceae bacterium]
MTRTADNQVQLFDEHGALIGTIVRPVTTEVLGPGAEKVYLARRPAGHTETVRAA